MKKTLLFSLASLAILFTQSVFSQQTSFSPSSVRKAVYTDVSAPLRDMPVIAPVPKGAVTTEVPNKIGKKEFNNLISNDTYLSEDPVWQKQNGVNSPEPAAPVQNFEGISNLSGVYPPDTQGDVGLDHYVQVVNSNFQVFSKTGTSLLGPAALSTIWAGIPAPWNGTNSGDPVVLYDQAANRWIITQFSLPNNTQYAELIAISQTADPTGSWYRYVFTLNLGFGKMVIIWQ